MGWGGELQLFLRSNSCHFCFKLQCPLKGLVRAGGLHTDILHIMRCTKQRTAASPCVAYWSIAEASAPPRKPALGVSATMAMILKCSKGSCVQTWARTFGASGYFGAETVLKFVRHHRYQDVSPRSVSHFGENEKKKKKMPPNKQRKRP